jgi:hypothetical protein
MRDDMMKVIVERPRHGHYYSNWQARMDRVQAKMKDPEDLPARLPMKPKIGWTKGFSENLSPLYRFLISRVGEKWDDVYSEISEQIKPGSTIQEHIRVHLFDFIETKTAMVGDEICIRDDRRGYISGERYL